jgi:hypothetical protein
VALSLTTAAVVPAPYAVDWLATVLVMLHFIPYLDSLAVLALHMY